MKKRKVIGLFVLLIVIIGILFPGRVMNTLLYYKNGSTLILNKYKIDFPLSHWAYFRQNNASYVLSGRKVNGKTLKLEVSEYFKIDLKNIFSGCDNLEKNTKNYKYIKGIEYICDYNEYRMMYFISNEKNLILNSSDNFNGQDKNELEEYDLLFNSISER